MSNIAAIQPVNFRLKTNDEIYNDLKSKLHLDPKNYNHNATYIKDLPMELQDIILIYYFKIQIESHFRHCPDNEYSDSICEYTKSLFSVTEINKILTYKLYLDDTYKDYEFSYYMYNIYMNRVYLKSYRIYNMHNIQNIQNMHNIQNMQNIKYAELNKFLEGVYPNPEIRDYVLDIYAMCIFGKQEDYGHLIIHELQNNCCGYSCMNQLLTKMLDDFHYISEYNNYYSVMKYGHSREVSNINNSINKSKIVMFKISNVFCENIRRNTMRKKIYSNTYMRTFLETDLHDILMLSFDYNKHIHVIVPNSTYDNYSLIDRDNNNYTAFDHEREPLKTDGQMKTRCVIIPYQSIFVDSDDFRLQKPQKYPYVKERDNTIYEKLDSWPPYFFKILWDRYNQLYKRNIHQFHLIPRPQVLDE